MQTMVLIVVSVLFASNVGGAQGVHKSAAKQEKPRSAAGSGTITSKTMVTSTEFLDFKDSNGNSYTCMLDTPDERFRDFREGDYIAVSGWKRPDEKIFGRCRIVMWKSTGSSSR